MTDFRTKGNAAYKAGDFKQAREQYKRAIDEAPTDATLWLNIAAADMALHAYADGAKGCVAALRHGGPSAKAAARLSNALCQVGAVEAATAVLDWGFTLDDAAAHGNQLSEARRLSSHLSAATSLMESMAGQPAQGHHAAAYADDAAQRLFDAAPSAPYAERLLLGLAEALLASGRLAAAGGLAASVLQQRGAGAVQGALVDPLDVSGVAGLSGAFADGRVAPPALPSAVALLAASHALRGDFGPAVATLERALPADPDGTTQEGREVQQLLKGLRRASERREQATAAYGAGKYEEALEGFREASERASSVLRGRTVSVLATNIAASLLALNRPSEAMAACDEAVRAWPFNHKAWARRAAAAEALKLPPEDVAADWVLSGWTEPPAAAAAAGPEADKREKHLFALRARSGDDSSGEEEVISHPANGKELAAMVDATAAPALRTALRGGLFTAPPAGLSSGAGAAAVAAAALPRRLAVVDVFTTWCGPCKAIAPHYERAAASACVPRFVKADGDRCDPGRWGVRAFPTFLALLDGREVGRLEGADPARLKALIADATQAWRTAASTSAAGSVVGPAATLLTAFDARTDVCVGIGNRLRSLSKS